jgi:MFS family permease
MLVIFSFLIGVAGSSAVTNVAASVSDMFRYEFAGQAMALFVVSANVGPSIGSPIGEAVAQHLGFAWWYWLKCELYSNFVERILIIWISVIIGGAFIVVLALLPETQPSVVIAKSDGTYDDPLAERIRRERKELNVGSEIYFTSTTALKILFTEPIVASLGIYNGFAFGLLFLYLDVQSF